MTGDKKYCDPSLANQEPIFSVLQTRRLPEIPLPSSYLQNLLCQYQCDDGTERRKTRKSRQRTNSKINLRKRRINGFIAFRSFYSRTIKGTFNQKELSSKLAAIWKDEPHHLTWNSYALQYNATGGDENFVDWLNMKLGFVSNTGDDTKFKTCKNRLFRNVEDVFYGTKNSDKEALFD